MRTCHSIRADLLSAVLTEDHCHEVSPLAGVSPTDDIRRNTGIGGATKGVAVEIQAQPHAPGRCVRRPRLGYQRCAPVKLRKALSAAVVAGAFRPSSFG